MRGPSGRRPPSFKSKRRIRGTPEIVEGESKLEFNNNENDGNTEPTDDKPNNCNQNQDTQEARIVKVSMKSRLKRYCSIM